ncbi:MAG: DUF2232 domain-containing protein [Synechococcales bacterium]|nr:DUF2232 domain-containing protein [Synechococcales bacterium]
MSGSFEDEQKDKRQNKQSQRYSQAPDDCLNAAAESSAKSSSDALDADWDDVDQSLTLQSDVQELSSPPPELLPSGQADNPTLQPPQIQTTGSPLSLVETAFLASTASLLWLISYYLSIGPWMRIVFPTPIALAYLRWGQRAAWMSAIVSCLLLSVLMGPYLSLLFLVPYGLLGVQLGALWKHRIGWPLSVVMGTIVATFSFFFRIWLLSGFLGEDVWVYLTGRITDLLEWFSTLLVDWGILGVGMLGQPDLVLVQLATIAMVVCSDVIYLFTVHLAAWLMLERLGNPIPDPPRWVQVLLDEAD